MLASSGFSTHGCRDEGREKTSKVTSQLPLKKLAMREGEREAQVDPRGVMSYARVKARGVGAMQGR